MFAFLLAANLNLLAPASEPPPAAQAKEEPAPAAKASPKAKPKVKLQPKLQSKDKDKDGTEAAAPAKAEDSVAAKATEKPARRRLPSPVIPAEEPAAAPVPKRVVRAPRRSIPPPAVAGIPGTVAPDARAARLEAENARLRQQLALTGAAVAPAIVDPGSALQELVAGNQRFVAGARVRTLLSTQDVELRESLAKGQNPFAVIITCSDSRLADNLIFDQELGRLFTIREAGNSPDLQSLASVEYAIEHLGSKLVVVMGHVGCGAVTAVNDAHGKPLPGNLWALQAAMSGLLESTPEDPNEAPAAHLYRLVEHNAQRQAQAVVDRSDLVRERVAQHKVKVLPAVYDLVSGKVTFLSAPRTDPGKAAHAE